MPEQHSENEERYFKSADQLRTALLDVYDNFREDLVDSGGEVEVYASVENAVQWQLAEHGLDLHAALERLERTGAAPKSAYASIERRALGSRRRMHVEGTLFLYADWQGPDGLSLSAEYVGADADDVLRVHAAIERLLTHHGRAEPYHPLKLKSETTPARWFESQWFGGLIGAIGGSVLTYFLPKLFG
ncbi:hypothetical protein [Curtobacterium sp. MEB011]|uniref:hypothetical protein n=1 Tax=Curtobacterium sp. MEB011 TaxID=3040285 RepID=UPI00254C7B33|nr:hypothetical protein [Curtobacterium sp. MEB011]